MKVVKAVKKDIVVNIIKLNKINVDARTSEVIIKICLSPDILGNTEVLKNEQ